MARCVSLLPRCTAAHTRRSDKLRAAREDALRQRDSARAEAATAYAEADALQATLADSAVYVRYLRRRVADLELQEMLNATLRGGAARASPPPPAAAAGAGSEKGDGGGCFSLAAIKASIQSAVKEAYACDEEAEKRRRIKALQLRWHPDKHQHLQELATEVSKLINEAVSAAEEQGGKDTAWQYDKK